MSSKPKIPRIVLEAISRVRASGLVNMLDARTVQTLSWSVVTKHWIEHNQGLYAKLIFEGPEAFEIIEGEI